MAGHSKWANIQHRKNAQDKKRGKVFTKHIREITISAKMGGGDPASNPRLRLAIDKALAANMTRDTIDRAIKRGAGGLDADNMEEVRYEGYGPAGVAVMVDCLTDNRNRTVGEVRHAFAKRGGNLGTDGSVSYLFSQQGHLSFPASVNENEIIEVALEAGAQDVEADDDGNMTVITGADDFEMIKQALIEKKLKPEFAEVTQVAATLVTLDKEAAEKLLALVDILEELDDVQYVYTNADIAPEIMQQL